MGNILEKLLDLWNLSQDAEVLKNQIDEINRINGLIKEDDDSDETNK